MKKGKSKNDSKLLRNMAIFVAGLLIGVLIGTKAPHSYFRAEIIDPYSPPPATCTDISGAPLPSHLEYPPGYDGSIYTCDLNPDGCTYHCSTM